MPSPTTRRSKRIATGSEDVGWLAHACAVDRFEVTMRRCRRIGRIWTPSLERFKLLPVQVFLAAWVKPYANDQAEILDVVEAIGAY